MYEMEHKKPEPPRKQLRQPPSVPFIWEERPGFAKRDWQPSLATFVPTPPPLPPPLPVPVKLVTSVPFRWEETPGKVLPSSNDPPKLPNPPLETATTPSLPPPVPVPVKLVTSVPFRWEKTPGKPLPSSSDEPPQLPNPPLETYTTPSLPPPVPVPAKLVTSVPFRWEETPGKPLPSSNDPPKLPNPPLETATTPSLPPPVPVPVKLVTSVPFRWEKTPGKPLPSSSDEPPQLPNPPLETYTTPSLPPPVPVPAKLVTSVPFDWEEIPGQPYPCFVDPNPPESLDQPLPPPPMYGELDTSSDIFDDASSDSFSSVPSLLTANRSVQISGALAVNDFDDNMNKETSSTPTSPAYESDDSTCSYMTGASSLVGASFLEKLFPRLLPPEKVKAADSKDVVQASTHPLNKEVKLTTDSDNMNIGYPVRMPQTLGELIMMSRRRSYMRRAVEMRKQNPYKEFTKNRAENRCLFVPGIKMIEGLEWKKYQPRLKLI